MMQRPDRAVKHGRPEAASVRLTSMEFPPLPDAVLQQGRAVCLALPEAVEVQTDAGVDFRIRRRTFAYLFAVADPAGRVHSMLACRADPEEREALLALGHPYFASRSGIDRLGVVLDDNTDWDEIAELVTDSYRLLAPKQLVARLDDRG